MDGPSAAEQTKNDLKTSARKGPRGHVTVFANWCKGCGICIEFCPKGVLKPAGLKGKPTVTDPSLCSKCMLCEVRCPDFAIRIRSEEDDDEDS